MKQPNETQSGASAPQLEVLPYERPKIDDLGTLRELTAGNKNASAPDQIVGIPPAFS